MIRVAAIADLHCQTQCPVRYRKWFSTLAGLADVLVVAGDLTHYGLVEEAHAAAAELRALGLPVVAVLGNHDYHSDRVPEVEAILRDAGIWLLQDGPFRLNVRGVNVGLVGAKGFGGGFGGAQLEPFGEPTIKNFVQETLAARTGLEQAISALETDFKVVVLHYSPVRGTLAGEPLELYPFLGSSLLAEPIDRYGADLVLHGHAHHGIEWGHTERGIPVRNVSRPVVKQYYVICELGG